MHLPRRPDATQISTQGALPSYMACLDAGEGRLILLISAFFPLLDVSHSPIPHPHPSPWASPSLRYGRLGAEDGLAFGSVHPTAALEFVLWLIKVGG